MVLSSAQFFDNTNPYRLILSSVNDPCFIDNTWDNKGVNEAAFLFDVEFIHQLQKLYSVQKIYATDWGLIGFWRGLYREPVHLVMTTRTSGKVIKDDICLLMD